jgi:hypothetical protein
MQNSAGDLSIHYLSVVYFISTTRYLPGSRAGMGRAQSSLGCVTCGVSSARTGTSARRRMAGSSR